MIRNTLLLLAGVVLGAAVLMATGDTTRVQLKVVATGDGMVAAYANPAPMVIFSSSGQFTKDETLTCEVGDHDLSCHYGTLPPQSLVPQGFVFTDDDQPAPAASL